MLGRKDLLATYVAPSLPGHVGCGGTVVVLLGVVALSVIVVLVEVVVTCAAPSGEPHVRSYDRVPEPTDPRNSENLLRIAIASLNLSVSPNIA